MASLFDRDTPASPPEPQLFDRAAPDKGVGIHYTDPGTIMKIIEPVVLVPLRREWEALKQQLAALGERHARAKASGERTRLANQRRATYLAFRARLGGFRVLDPACGSGNFLALALAGLKDFDLAVLKEAEGLGLPADNQRVGPEAVLGIEINPYAAELARLTVWITELQWQLRNGFGVKRAPILGKLDGIVCRDALLNLDGSEASWPDADVVIGNPPFLGNKRMIASLGREYVQKLRDQYADRVSGETDLVAYWFAKAWERISIGKMARAGLVATQSIRSGANRRLLDTISRTGMIFDAWSDEPWVVEGVAVRVSLVCFGASGQHLPAHLNGRNAERINPDLTATGSDLTSARRLSQNADRAFQGPVKVGPFEVPGQTARTWLQMPENPNGRPNADVVRPWVNGMDITRRTSDTWIVDFGDALEETACLYEAPFEHVRRHVRPMRQKNRRERRRIFWWQHGETVPGLRAALAELSRYIVTPRVAKHRIFAWMHKRVLPDSRVSAIAREDDTSFGILHSHIHELWTLATCSWHGVGNDPTYNGESVFETFPFPEGLTPNIPATDYAGDRRAVGIANAARKLDDLRQTWLNPPDLVQVVPEVVPGFPDRILPRGKAAEEELKKRTLTKLYNERPTWLANAHRDLDAAVAAAYGWPADIPDDDALARLLELNRSRASATGKGDDNINSR